jgi:hypothetical protein
MLPEQIIYFAICLNLIGYTFYIKSIIQGHAKPNLASWIPWMLAPLIGVFFELKAGAGLSVLPVFMAGFGPLIIITAAILTKNALWKVGFFDIFCALLSVVALVLYVLTHNLNVSIVFAILSDAFGFIPTFIKSWKHPESESSAAYTWPIFSNLIGLLIIKDWHFSIYAFGAYLIIFNTALVCIIYRKRIFRTKIIS